MGRFFMGLCLLLHTGLSAAAPFIPEDEDTVLLRLNNRTDPRIPLPAANGSERQDLTTAQRRARSYIDIARRDDDPRYLGYAQAIVQPWLQRDPVPVEMLVLQGIIHQRRHQFETAAELFVRSLQRAPRNTQALLSLAGVYRVQGKLDAALQQCKRLLSLRPDVVGLTCQANMQSLQGHLRKSLRLLQSAAQNMTGLEPGTQSWVHTSIAQMALRLGQTNVARQYFELALTHTPDDAYTLASYSDLLLALNEPQAVIDLLGKRTQQDTLLLRLILAGQAVDHPQTAQWTETLQARFAATRLRGEDSHLREQSRFALDVLQQPQQALDLAQRNWAEQREPEDLLLLLRAARAAGTPAAARPARQWVRQHGYEDQRLTGLIRP